MYNAATSTNRHYHVAPPGVTAAHTRRTTTDQQLTTRAAELGFASLRAYLTDRAITRQWPTTSIAGELGVQPATVRDRLDQHRLPRGQATRRPYWATARQTACWPARRQARLADVRSICGCGGWSRAGRVGARSPSCGWVPHG
jgi:hypothetical protein